MQIQLFGMENNFKLSIVMTKIVYKSFWLSLMRRLISQRAAPTYLSLKLWQLSSQLGTEGSEEYF